MMKIKRKKKKKRKVSKKKKRSVSKKKKRSVSKKKKKNVSVKRRSESVKRRRNVWAKTRTHAHTPVTLGTPTIANYIIAALRANKKAYIKFSTMTPHVKKGLPLTTTKKLAYKKT